MYERLASDVDLEEEAEIRGLEGPLPAVVPTVMGVEAGRTTLEAAVRAGAIIVETAFVGGGGRGDDGRGPAEVLRTPECNRTRVRAEATPSVPRKTKRMDRRLTHWQCAFCRSETALSEESDRCRKCNGPREQLGRLQDWTPDAHYIRPVCTRGAYGAVTPTSARESGAYEYTAFHRITRLRE